MSKLMIRSPGGNWLDICESEWYVLDDNHQWVRLSPSKGMKVRHGGNTYWLDVTCDEDYPTNCPPEDEVLCFPGHTGNFDGGLINVTKTHICDCDGNNCITYTNKNVLTTGANTPNAGTYENPLSVPVTIYGGKAEINEFWVDLGQVSGMAHLSGLRPNAYFRVRVYKGCKLVADTSDENSVGAAIDSVQTRAISWLHDTSDGSGLVLVRVDGVPKTASWEISLTTPNYDFSVNTVNPAPHGTFKINTGCASNVFERYHRITATGVTWLDLDLISPTKVSVYYNGALLTSTNGFVNGRHDLKFQFIPRNGNFHVLFRFETESPLVDAGFYSIYLAGTKGSIYNPETCGITTYSTKSNVFDKWFDLAGQPTGKVTLYFDPFGGKPTQILVYYAGGLVAATDITTTSQYLSFEYNPNSGTYVYIRVITECCGDWGFHISCAVEKPQIYVSDAAVTRPGAGQRISLCFPVTLSKAFDSDVSFDFAFGSSNALQTADCGQPPVATVFDISSQSSWSDSMQIPDYIPVSGRATLPAGATQGQICLDICGTDRVGPTRTVDFYIGNISNANPVDTQALGTIYNPNTLTCSFDNTIAVKDGGVCEYLGSYGARRMYLQESLDLAKEQFSGVVTIDLYIPAEGTYTLVGFADDLAEVYVDCKYVFSPDVSHKYAIRHWLPEGYRRIHIIYNNIPARTPSYTSFAILNNDGSVLYGSDASHWRGVILNEGLTPNCTQFNEGSTYLNMQNISYLDGNEYYLNQIRQYGAEAIQPIGSQNRPDFGWFTAEKIINFPNAGTYTIYLTADDKSEVFIDCVSVGTGGFDYMHTGSFYTEAGDSRIIVRTYNMHRKKPCWFIFAIRDANGNTVYGTDAAGWKMRAGDVDNTTGWL